MNAENNDRITYLPLFLHMIDPLIVITLDNEIVVFRENLSNELFPDRVLSLLVFLYNNPITMESLPEEFTHFFLNEEIQMMFQSLIGDEIHSGQGSYFALDLSIEVLDDAHSSVLLKDFTLDSNNLNYQVKIPPKELFFILANLCVECVDKWGFADVQKLEKHVNKVLQSSSRKNVKLIYSFSLSYVKFLKRLMDTERISPRDILMRGGSNTLSMLTTEKEVETYVNRILRKIAMEESLTLAEKIAYSTLCNVLNDQYKPHIYPLIEKFYNQEKSKIKKLEDELMKLSKV